jgi:hypothetical protein
VQADDPETAVGRVIELVKTRIPKRFGLDPIRDIQVLCPMNRGGVGARSLNIELQARHLPDSVRQRIFLYPGVLIVLLAFGSPFVSMTAPCAKPRRRLVARCV